MKKEPFSQRDAAQRDPVEGPCGPLFYGPLYPRFPQADVRLLPVPKQHALDGGEVVEQRLLVLLEVDLGHPGSSMQGGLGRSLSRSS